MVGPCATAPVGRVDADRQPCCSLGVTDADRLRALLIDEPAVELAVLFGSRAGGRARVSSDVDIGLEWAPDADERRKRAVLNAVERALGASVDAVDLTSAPPMLRFEIARTGVLLVSRAPGRWSDVKARAMSDWWDFAPLARTMDRAVLDRLERLTDGSP